VLGGKYRIERELGSGGMGIVYEVTHLVMTQSRFAIKWLLPAKDTDSGSTRRFKREAQISGAIRHPNVVEVYDVNLDDSGAYLVMELLEGENLADRIVRAGALPAAEACRIAMSALAGLSAAHAAGVIHRDLKPANIFLCHTEEDAVRPKLLDFGVSHAVSQPGSAEITERTRKGVVGTPAYMAPEQLRAADCDQRTDIYSLGVTLYEALAGQPAFVAPSHADLVVKIITGDKPSLRQRVANLPAGLADVVMRAMHRSPEMRFASAATFANALAPFAAAAPPPPLAHTRPTRRWLVAAAGGVLWIVAVVGVVLAALSLRSIPRVPWQQPAQVGLAAGTMLEPATKLRDEIAPLPQTQAQVPVALPSARSEPTPASAPSRPEAEWPPAGEPLKVGVSKPKKSVQRPSTQAEQASKPEAARSARDRELAGTVAPRPGASVPEAAPPAETELPPNPESGALPGSRHPVTRRPKPQPLLDAL
jgi:serine/threonine-protein kinase